MSPDSIVFGAAGFIGRSLVAELLDQGNQVAAALRPGSAARLTDWLDARGTDQRGLTVLTCDITEPGLGLAGELDSVRDVYNSAAAFAWGLSTEQANRVNVSGALNVLDWAGRLPALRRLVHITGYRAALKDTVDGKAKGGYESSKLEADSVLTARATAEGIPLTIANPSTVIGPGQYLGLADIVRDLWQGTLPAVPGDRGTFIPVVTVEYFARFLASLPTRVETIGKSYTVLDNRTPTLPVLVRQLAAHLGVRAPRRQIPVGVIRALPRFLTGVEPETLTFLSGDRYDTSAAEAHALAVGLRMPPVDQALREWADHLVASRFGELDPSAGGFQDGTWIVGDRVQPSHVLLHGLPVDSDSWAGVTGELGRPLLADLPGLGRSAESSRSMAAWLDDLLAPVTTRPVLVAHSLACDPAIRFAVAHPERISRLVLVAPAFLQAPGGRVARSWLAAVVLRRASGSRLARILGVADGPAVAAAASNLRRPGVAKRTVSALRAAVRGRAELRELLERVEVPVEIVAGSLDPVTTTRSVLVVPEAGHYPQISHPLAVANVVR